MRMGPGQNLLVRTNCGEINRATDGYDGYFCSLDDVYLR